ncbi:MAG: 16S rRNA (uracil(1498)-N(3))-methyltransferase [Candidatus Omnitrophica bacterium]|nr:16S rRNA (uracil(1498)-N(3))-methyltransferase [Candidatus Omnitrophota bacterium]
MSIPRFFVNVPKFDQSETQITDPTEIHHLIHVLRLKEGETISIFNGKDSEAIGEIAHIDRQKVTVRINSVKTMLSENSKSLILACAIPKKSKFESIIEKCTELGIDEIIPLQTQRTEVRLKDEKSDKKRLRYQAVAVNAAKQSQRLTIPRIHPIQKFSEALNHLQKDDLALIPTLEGQRQSLHEVLSLAIAKKRIVFFIGPEGDFSPEEILMAQKAGCIPISLGSTVLKVDTAAIAVTALLNLTKTS